MTWKFYYFWEKCHYQLLTIKCYLCFILIFLCTVSPIHIRSIIYNHVVLWYHICLLCIVSFLSLFFDLDEFYWLTSKLLVPLIVLPKLNCQLDTSGKRESHLKYCFHQIGHWACLRIFFWLLFDVWGLSPL